MKCHAPPVRSVRIGCRAPRSSGRSTGPARDSALSRREMTSA
ncbi:hypothetical protein L810_2555 [Burkholderia sp. AU4i]|nr:hypothetical protein L810_2555 [Burkholderia sp. AU4i]